MFHMYLSYNFYESLMTGHELLSNFRNTKTYTYLIRSKNLFCKIGD